MPYNTKPIKKDDSGLRPIPQHFNSDIDDYEVQKGKYGATSSLPLGGLTADYLEGQTSVTKTYKDDMYGISFANDGLEILTFTINGITRTIYPGEPYNAVLPPFKSVTINAKDKFRMEVLR